MNKRKRQGETHDVYVKVLGAGTEGVNGNYYPTEETIGDVQTYSQSGRYYDREGRYYDHEDGTFVIWCSRKEYWHISTLPKRESTIMGDSNYYECKAEYGSTTPPGSGWKTSRFGSDKPPKITFISQESTTDLLRTVNCKMLFSEKFSDVHFHCPDGTIIHAHKMFLSANSSYFATVFEGPWGDQHPDGVWKTSNSANLMRVILMYIYTNTYDNAEISKDLLGVLSLAHEYNLVNLVRSIEKQLIDRVSKENVKVLIKSATLYDLSELKTSCFKCISENYLDFFKDDYVINILSEDKNLLKAYLTFAIKYNHNSNPSARWCTKKAGWS